MFHNNTTTDVNTAAEMDDARSLRSFVRRLAAVTIAAGIGVVGLAASPAAADRPTNVTDSAMFEDINPCTGEPMLVTLHIDAIVHQHDSGNVIARAHRTGTTSDGYVMDHGVDTFVFNGNVARGTVMDMFRNSDGSAFQAVAHVVEKEDGLQTADFRLRCITP